MCHRVNNSQHQRLPGPLWCCCLSQTAGSTSVWHTENCELTDWRSRKTSLRQVWHQNSSLSNSFSIEVKPNSGLLVSLIADSVKVDTTMWRKLLFYHGVKMNGSNGSDLFIFPLYFKLFAWRVQRSLLTVVTSNCGISWRQRVCNRHAVKPPNKTKEV